MLFANVFSFSLFGTWSHYVAQASLDLLGQAVFLLQLPKQFGLCSAPLMSVFYLFIIFLKAQQNENSQEYEGFRGRST